jgi:L-arabinose isomerase
VLTNPDSIRSLCIEANSEERCVGLIAWMHTFSPAKMWIAGLSALRKPFVHLHTQFNRDLPWSDIDMDFMNLNQSAHGDREFGYICARMRKNRKVVVGHWQDPDVHGELASWLRVASAWRDSQCAKIARFGDNMREVAVTEGDKVEAQMRLGYSVNGYGLGELVPRVDSVSEAEVEKLTEEYDDAYAVVPSLRKGGEMRVALADAARIELGLRSFLDDGGFSAFTTTFEDLHGLKQLPGLAVQRLMHDGYGFGAEGDWKTAALVRAMKVMSAGLGGGTSFMEDYTYHLAPGDMKVLGAHRLEVCPSLSSGKPSLEIHPLSIGGKSDPVRLVFGVPDGAAINASLVDMGNRFRLVTNEVRVVQPGADMERLPVAHAVWIPMPDLRTAANAWITAGGAHHTGFSTCVSADQMEDFADMAGIECLRIDSSTRIPDFKNALRWNEAYYGHAARL